jgi:hypothetical protein
MEFLMLRLGTFALTKTTFFTFFDVKKTKIGVSKPKIEPVFTIFQALIFKALEGVLRIC